MLVEINNAIPDTNYILEVLMKSARFLMGAFCIAGALTLGACNADVKTEADGDDSLAITPAPGAANEVSGEMIQGKVSAALVAAPGFGGVDVTSTTPGVIVLNGTVPTEDDKGKAQMIAQNVEGVTSVTNNLTVAR